jgi:bifunctional UDP-N-acetylglucosamine pyrophosphorylase/glucosamine-1-phosphate N-acetyltransferase
LPCPPPPNPSRCGVATPPRRRYKGGAFDPRNRVSAEKPARSLAAVILAAGEGKRLRSDRPKVLQPVCGRPALWHILVAAKATRPDRIVVVVHRGREQVEAAVRSWGLTPEPVFVNQGEPLGTAHAVLAAKKAIGDATEVLVLAGDDPLVEAAHLRGLMTTHRRRHAAATIMTTQIEDATGYGRVVREGSSLVGILEETDAPPEVRAIKEISTLFYAFQREHLFRALPKVGRENRQREYYLPDVLAILLDTGEEVVVVREDRYRHVGLNSRAGLAKVNELMRERINATHLSNGVTLIDPAQTYIDVGVKIGRDSTVYPLTFLEGTTRIGAECVIGPSVGIRDTRVDDRARVSFSVVEGARIGRQAEVGPFARIRPGTVLEEGAKAGTFVEIKKSKVGRGSKVPHLSYVGDATLGSGVNIGAATITVNWDGYAKNPTVIDDDVRIGSDTMLVAPVRIGKGAVTGAGSVITKDVPAGALAVERAEQRNVPGYRKRKDAEAPATKAQKAKKSSKAKARTKTKTGGKSKRAKN